MNDILNRIDNMIGESSYRQTVVHGSPLDTTTNEGPQLPPHLANSLSIMTGIDVQSVDAFVELVNQGQSIAAAASEVGLSIGQAHDLKTAMVDVGLKIHGDSISESASHPGADDARRIGDFLYRLAEAIESGEEDAGPVIQSISEAVRGVLGNDTLDEVVDTEDDPLNPSGFQKYYDINLPHDATVIAQTYAEAVCDNLPSSHPGRVTCTFGAATGDADNAIVQGRDEDGNELTITVVLGGSPPYVNLEVGGDLGSSVTMKINEENWMAALSMLMQHAVRAWMQKGYSYSEAI